MDNLYKDRKVSGHVLGMSIFPLSVILRFGFGTVRSDSVEFLGGFLGGGYFVYMFPFLFQGLLTLALLLVSKTGFFFHFLLLLNLPNEVGDLLFLFGFLINKVR